jgi:hypothetical protein
MKTTLALLLLCVASLLAEPKLPPSKDIVEFANTPASPAPPEPDRSLKNVKVERADLDKIFDHYFTVSHDLWLDRYSHTPIGDRTGTVTLKDGTELKWMVRLGGLATVTFPDGTVLYLAASKPDPK